jgi:hypothetical protein
MRGRWRNVENAQSEKAIMGITFNSKIVSLIITRWPMFVLLTLIAFINYGCIPYQVAHRKETPISKETRIASGPEATKVRELRVSSQPTGQHPQAPLTLIYSEWAKGPQEEVVRYAERKYLYTWSPLYIPSSILIAGMSLFGDFPAPKLNAYAEERKEWGCPYTPRDMFYYGVMGVLPCAQTKHVSINGQAYKDLPVVEEIRPTGLTAEAILPMAERPVQVTVATRGSNWNYDTVLIVLTDAEGKQGIPLDSMFKEFPNAPLEVSVILTADEAQTRVHLDSQVSEAIYTHVRK